MKRSTEREGTVAHGIDEVEITIRIEEGKITAESRSGPKDGTIELGAEGRSARLDLIGAGSDRATATLSAPELANFRTIVDAALSTLRSDDAGSELERRAVYSGYRPLRSFGDDLGVSLEPEALDELNLLSDSGDIPGGSRQVQCTVLRSGTAIINLTGDDGGMQF